MGSLRRFLVAGLLALTVCCGAPAFAAFDASSRSNGGNWSTGVSNYTYSHTTAGTDRFLAVSVAIFNSAARTVTGITYNGVALTKLHSITAALEGNTQDFEVWYLINPTVGANTISVTLSASASFTQSVAISYNGIDQVAPIDSQAIGQSLVAADTFAQATTVVSSQASLITFAWPRATPPTSVGGIARIFSLQAGAGADSNGNVPTGSQSLTWTRVGATSWPGVSSFSILTTAAEAGRVTAPKLVSGGVIENISVWGSKLVGAAAIENESVWSSKIGANIVLAADVDMWVSKLIGYVVMTGEINASVSELAAATDTLNIFPAGGGGGGAAGIFGNGGDGCNANYDGTGGCGGFADAGYTAGQPTPGATGLTGIEWDSITGSGGGGAGGNYNPAGVGQDGGAGGVYGGGGGGGGVGSIGPAALGGQGGDGIVWIQYRSTSTGLYVTVILTAVSVSPWIVPADWSDINKIALLGAGGCGQDAGGFKGGDGGSGGSAVGGINITGITPAASMPFHVNTGAEACNVTQVQTTFAGGAAGAGGNGGGGGGGGSVGLPNATVSFTYYPGLGGPGGTLSEPIFLSPPGGLHPWQPLTHW